MTRAERNLFSVSRIAVARNLTYRRLVGKFCATTKTSAAELIARSTVDFFSTTMSIKLAVITGINHAGECLIEKKIMAELNYFEYTAVVGVDEYDKKIVKIDNYLKRNEKIYGFIL